MNRRKDFVRSGKRSLLDEIARAGGSRLPCPTATTKTGASRFGYSAGAFSTDVREYGSDLWNFDNS